MRVRTVVGSHREVMPLLHGDVCAVEAPAAVVEHGDRPTGTEGIGVPRHPVVRRVGRHRDSGG